MSTAETVLELVRDRRMVRPRDLEAAGISPTHLQRLYEQGMIERSSRGVYLPLDAPLDPHQTLAEVALRVPSGIVCLLSALQFHQFTTQSPHQVWLALPPRTHRPQLDSVSLRLFQMSGPLLTEGIEAHELGGASVRITSPARTVADCFKFRNKIGLDIALEALTDGWRRRKFTMDEVWRYGKLCRVSNIMRPYLETLSL
ncbi:type IV toxin-antitoxin system AbiEi family antitoxin domain-containing protein [Armatimonas sp.]|uniref:type IV toxin-antitoxin system AbiEi family antitoxin domain-containing protein n=1 Tax=Armatimonas sp. TaxID=1872638 RepID=UPI003750EB01